MLRERGPILQARPIQPSPIGVLYCDSVNGDRARATFEPILRQKLEKFGIHSHIGIAVPEHEDHISCGIQQLLQSNAGAVLIVSPTVPAGLEDAAGRAMAKVGCRIERYLAPVEPGHLLLLGYQDDTPGRFGAGVLPFAQEKCRGFASAADDGAVPDIGMGSGWHGARRTSDRVGCLVLELSPPLPSNAIMCFIGLGLVARDRENLLRLRAIPAPSICFELVLSHRDARSVRRADRMDGQRILAARTRTPSF